MKYYLLDTDQKNRIPYNINKNHAIDTRYLIRENIDKIPMWNVVEMTFPNEGFFPDLLCNPWILMSECFIKTIMMYQPDIPHKGMKLWDKENGNNATYFFPFLDEVDCLSDKSIYNTMGNRIICPVLERQKIGERVIFRIKDYNEKCVVGRVDFVESLLRRGVAGISIKEADVV